MTLNLPDFILSATSGELNLSKNLADYIVLYFYPKDDTPGCTLESQDFSTHYDTFNKLGVSVYGVSRDSIKSHDKFKCKFALPFELISDENETLCHYFKVLKLKKNYGKEYVGIERSTFLFKQGELMKEWRGVKVAGHVLEIIREINKNCAE